MSQGGRYRVFGWTAWYQEDAEKLEEVWRRSARMRKGGKIEAARQGDALLSSQSARRESRLWDV